jgi:hypothetical protein
LMMMAMDTSETRLEPPQFTTRQFQKAASSSGGARTACIAVTPFNPNPQTQLAKAVVAKLRVLSRGLERRSSRSIVSAQEPERALSAASSVGALDTTSASRSTSSDSLARGRIHTLGHLTHSASRRARTSPSGRASSTPTSEASRDPQRPGSPRGAAHLAKAGLCTPAVVDEQQEARPNSMQAGGGALLGAAVRPGQAPDQL